MKCIMCKGLLVKENRDIFRRQNSKRVRIKDVPVEVCSICGDVYIDDQEVEVIDKILDNLKTNNNHLEPTIIADFDKSLSCSA